MKRPTAFTDTESVNDAVETRIGLNDAVCGDCDANNPDDADKCRKCGSKSLRRKHSDFANER